MSLEIKPIEISPEEEFWLEELSKIKNGVIINNVFIEGYVYFALKYTKVNNVYPLYTDEELVEKSKEFRGITKVFDFTLKGRKKQYYFAVKK